MEKLKNVKYVIFDCDNTLLLHRKDEAKMLANALGIPFNFEFKKQYSFMLRHCYVYFETKKVTLKKFTQLVDICMPILIKHKISAEEFMKVWFSLNCCFINEDTIDVLNYLQAKDYKIIILTDTFYEKQSKLLEDFNITPYIDNLYTIDNNYLKRNPKSISRVITSKNKEEYIMVGDSLEHDIAFAMNSKIRSIWFNPEYKNNNTKYKPTIEISSLLEICRML